VHISVGTMRIPAMLMEHDDRALHNRGVPTDAWTIVVSA
jgi:hypothetical protein